MKRRNSPYIMPVVRNGFLIAICFFSSYTYSQKEADTIISEMDQEYFIIEGDTIAYDAIALNEVLILGELKFDNNQKRREYLILKRKTRKVFPYAKLAAERLYKLNQRIAKIKSKRKQKKYIKQVQSYIEDEFTEELKKLTRTEGQILVKLVHRQTGITMFDLIKDFRSGWKAFWYNNTAKLFNISLKKEYLPMDIYEDYLIEDILHRAFTDEALESQESAIDIDFPAIMEKWKN